MLWLGPPGFESSKALRPAVHRYSSFTVDLLNSAYPNDSDLLKLVLLPERQARDTEPAKSVQLQLFAEKEFES